MFKQMIPYIGQQTAVSRAISQEPKPLCPVNRFSTKIRLPISTIKKNWQVCKFNSQVIQRNGPRIATGYTEG